MKAKSPLPLVGSVVLIDDGSVCELVEKEKRLAHLKTNYEQLCAKFEQRIEAELRADEDARTQDASSG